MKKISFYLLGVAMMGMAMTSCQKEEWAKDSIVASFENNSSKTHLAGRDRLTNKWDISDPLDPEQITMVYAITAPTVNNNGTATGQSVSTRKLVYTATQVGPGGMTAEFRHPDGNEPDLTNMNKIGGRIELYYPASCFVGCTTKVDVTRTTSGWGFNQRVNFTYANYTVSGRKIKMPYFQTKNDVYSHDTRDWPMYGYVEEDQNDDGCYYASFYNLCGGLRLQLKSDDFHAAVTKITVYTDDKALTGEMPVVNTPTGFDANPDANETHLCAQTYTTTAAGSDNIRRIIYQPSQNIVALDGTDYTDFDICLPVGEYDNLYIRIEGVDGTYCLKKLNSQSLTIRRDELKVIQFDLDFTPPEGAVLAYYSVSPTKSVYFAQGNLRYDGTNHTHDGRWYFANNQWDMLTSVSDLMQESTGAFGRYRSGDGRIRHWVDGDGNVHNNTTWRYGQSQDRGGTRHTYYDNTNNNVWELFGWSSGANDHYGVATEHGSSNESYYNGGFVDWGTLPIENGGNQPHQWRTLYGGQYTPGRDNFGEWDYLMNHRIADGKIVYTLPDAYISNPAYNLNGQTKACWAIVRVNGVPGILLFPDRFNWNETSLGVDRIPRYMNMNPPNWTDGNVINYTYDEINHLCGLNGQTTTGCGCTFMPAAGSREGYTTEQVCYLLRYWLNSQPDAIHGRGVNGESAYYIGFTEEDDDDRQVVPADSAHNLYWGRAVRLAMDAQPWDTRGTDNPWLEKGSHGSKGSAIKPSAILRKKF